mmetsp:Transcript_14882/g.32845  ORF Transcript_14882/g.32845 Transcript_14882/m.32845 type:complete len:242 (+) Transcript_14882:2971-3696(+)
MSRTAAARCIWSACSCCIIRRSHMKTLMCVGSVELSSAECATVASKAGSFSCGGTSVSGTGAGSDSGAGFLTLPGRSSAPSASSAKSGATADPNGPPVELRPLATDTLAEAWRLRFSSRISCCIASMSTSEGRTLSASIASTASAMCDASARTRISRTASLAVTMSIHMVSSTTLSSGFTLIFAPFSIAVPNCFHSRGPPMDSSTERQYMMKCIPSSPYVSSSSDQKTSDSGSSLLRLRTP